MLLVLAVVAFCQVLVPRASGQAVTPYKYVPNDSGDQCLASLPIPSPAPGLHRVLQLVNCSNQSLLGAANAAQQKGGQPVPVMPREGTWVMGPVGATRTDGSPANVLTIDVPLTWENTKCPPNYAAAGKCEGIVGPRFWTRTGCRYDLGFDKAQCETGGCSGRYDCSAARQSNSVGTTVSEWTFAEPVSNAPAVPAVTYFKDSPDISAVDGVNLDMDIEPLNGDKHNPFDIPQNCTDYPPGQAPPPNNNGYCQGHDIQWLPEQYPLAVHGQDVRAICTSSFQLTRSTLTTGNPYGFVYVNGSGQPVDSNGNVDNGTVACFSNCGKYAFPVPPPETCNPTPGSPCYYWDSFCLGNPAYYGPTKKCTTDSQCQVNAACWDQKDPNSTINLTCQGRAFVANQDICGPQSNGTANPNCPYVTYQYGYTDKYTNVPGSGAGVNWGTQPPLGLCSSVAGADCIGDDTLHKDMPKAYTWPNDPQVYGGDATAYRVISAPGGTNQPITPLTTIAYCKDLPGAESVYGYSGALANCAGPINYGSLFALARPLSLGYPKNLWSCDLDPTAAANEAVICKWGAASPAKVVQLGLRGNFNASGSNLQLSVLPASLLQAGDMLLASITFNPSVAVRK